MAHTRYPPAPPPTAPIPPSHTYVVDSHAPHDTHVFTAYSPDLPIDQFESMKLEQAGDRIPRRDGTSPQILDATGPAIAYVGFTLRKNPCPPAGSSPSWSWVILTPITARRQARLVDKVKSRNARRKGNVKNDIAALTSSSQKRQVEQVLQRSIRDEDNPNVEWSIASVEDEQGHTKHTKRRQETRALHIILKRQVGTIVVHGSTSGDLVGFNIPMRPARGFPGLHDSEVTTFDTSLNATLPWTTDVSRFYAQPSSPSEHPRFAYQSMPTMIGNHNGARYSQYPGLNPSFVEDIENPIQIMDTAVDARQHPQHLPEPRSHYPHPNVQLKSLETRNHEHKARPRQPSVIRITTGSNTHDLDHARRQRGRPSVDSDRESNATSIENLSSNNPSADHETPLSTPPSAGDASPGRHQRKSRNNHSNFLDHNDNDKAYWDIHSDCHTRESPRRQFHRRLFDGFPSDYVEIIPHRTDRTRSDHRDHHHHENARYSSRCSHPQDRIDTRSNHNMDASYHPPERMTARHEHDHDIMRRSEHQQRQEEARHFVERRRQVQTYLAMDERERMDQAERERDFHDRHEAERERVELAWHRQQQTERDVQRREDAVSWNGGRQPDRWWRTDRDGAREYGPRSWYIDERSPFRVHGGRLYHV